MREHALAFALLVILSPCLIGQPPSPKAPTTRFTDVTATSGLKLNVEHRPGRPEYGTQMPHGVAIEDFDGDSLPDILFVCFGPPYVKLYRNLGILRFADITKDSGLESFQGWGTGVCVGDFDRDGILDIYITSVEFEKGNRKATPPGKESRLYKGLGKGKFKDVTKEAGVLLNRPARCCAWSDIDGDGWLDLFVACPYGANVLYRNNRDGTFSDITESASVALPDRASLGCTFGDIDGDGLDDLFVTSLYSQSSALFKNLGGAKFRDITRDAGLDRKASAVACVFADVFNRGRLDLFVTTDSWLGGVNATEEQLRKKGSTVEPNLLYRNDGNGRFSIAAFETLKHKALSHDAILEDFDHDGLVDIYVGVDAIPTGNKFATHKGGNPLWTRSDRGTWKEVSRAWGVNHEANCVCVAAADFDNDGDLDLLLVNFYTNAVVYRNNTNDRNWLRVKAVGSKSNLDGIGTPVSVFKVTGDKKELVGFRQIQSGSGYCRCSPLEVHFGLGMTPEVEYQVEVIFPATSARVIRKGIRPGQRIVIREAEGLP